MGKIIEVFKTTVSTNFEAGKIRTALQKKMQSAKINFDLDDIDNILRIEDNVIISFTEVEKTVNEYGHKVEVLQ